MNTVIYARYSSHAQNEQSIEGQLKVCYEYAEANGMTVIGEYIDRAQSGTNDKREEFQKMLVDSANGSFDTVLVYQLDRFARNRYDSAVNKAILRKNGVRVVSSRENITDDASGILVEGVLESLAEYFSAELSQKVRRGMLINAEKCKFNGGTIPFGYSVDSDKNYVVNPDQAFIVIEIFERYASGETIQSIKDDLKIRQIKTNKGSFFDKSSIQRLLRNKRYTGTYIYGEVEIPDGIPFIVPQSLFDRVQPMLDKNAHAPGRTKGENEYLLTTKLFCGYCKEMMTGYSGTSKNGNTYQYYICKGAKKKKCSKKNVGKEYIEEEVLKVCRKLLNDANIDKMISGVAAACDADYENSAIHKLEQTMKDLDKSISNLLDSIEKGVPAEMLAERIKERTAEKAAIAEKIEFEKRREFRISGDEIKAFFYKLKNGNQNDTLCRRGLINIFVSAVYLYDDKMTIYFNGSEKPIVITDILLEGTENYFRNGSGEESSCSSVKKRGSPNEKYSIAVVLKKRYCIGMLLFFHIS